MASVVDICNLALSHIANSAEVTSIAPLDGSAEADHCARFYPIARDICLESHMWSFATARLYLSQLATNPQSDVWAFAYGLPNEMIRPIAVLLPGNTGSTVATPQTYVITNPALTPPAVQMESQPYLLETNADGTGIIYTNVEDAQLKYIYRQTDPTRFTPMFTSALSTMLGSFLAGPLTKDIRLKEGLKKIAINELADAAAFNKAQKTNTYRDFTPGHIAARG